MLDVVQRTLSQCNPFCHIFIHAPYCINSIPTTLSFALSPTRQRPLALHAPNVDEVAVAVVGNDRQPNDSRDILLQSRDCGLQRISNLHSVSAPLHYVLLFPLGTPGWHGPATFRNLVLTYRRTQRPDHSTKTDSISLKVEYITHPDVVNKWNYSHAGTMTKTSNRGMSKLVQAELTDACPSCAVKEKRFHIIPHDRGRPQHRFVSPRPKSCNNIYDGPSQT